MPLRNLVKIFFLPSFLKLFLIRAQWQNIYFFLFIVCLFVCAVDTGVNEGEPVEKFAEQYPSRSLKNRTASRNSRKDSKTASSISSFDRIFWPSFINTTYWPVLLSCICFYCWKHGWIATSWFVTTIPWPIRLMSKYDLFYLDVNRC